ncbi:universal stress protein [Actinokineospora enzanensis]|uniref:universal stress protein n=1 Tax=Actinokineospora enzanensis TaxID=155975 RepID=UPI0007C5B65A|nr:universal stress protein [Actinokineospora enzanensis]
MAGSDEAARRVPVGAIVVGVDGTEASEHAVDWAVGEAAGRPLVLVRVVELIWPVTRFPMMASTDFAFDSELLRRSAAEMLDKTARRVRDRVPDVHTVLIDGSPGVRLGEFAHEQSARLLVVGAGERSFLGTILGSTTSGVLRSPAIPTVIVRGVAPTAGRVVVGIDGSDTGQAAVEFAADYAERHRATLVAVHAWSDRPISDMVAGFFAGLGDNHPEVAAEHLVEEQLAGVMSAHPGLAVEKVHRVDRPADALVEAATGARLLVVGSHGRGLAARLTLGSVSHAVVHHAPCPVAIIAGAPG